MSETYDMSPDWDYLAEELRKRGYFDLAEQAENENLSKKQVYGKVMNILDSTHPLQEAPRKGGRR